MLDMIDYKSVKSILEPSAGKGNIIDGIKNYKIKVRDYSFNAFEKIEKIIDCIEINPDLRCLLKGKGFYVIHNDFLTFKTFKKYDLIIMNPPFSEGDKHLLKAIDLQKNGGQICCLLNAQTIKNPYNQSRQELMKMLVNLDAKIKFIENAFSDSERKTDVEVALIYIKIEEKEIPESEIYQNLKKAAKIEEPKSKNPTDVALTDLLNSIVSQYEVEVAATLKLVNEFESLKPYISSDIGDKSAPIISLTYRDSEGHSRDFTLNEYLKKVRYKYWKALFTNQDFTGRLTSELRDKWYNMIDDMQNYDFSLFNIHEVQMKMNKEMVGGVKETIMKLFEKLTADHSWFPEMKNNVHYFNGWCTNQAHKIGKKVIIPTYCWRTNWQGKKELDKWEAYDSLIDIEKSLSYLDCNISSQSNIKEVLDRSFNKNEFKNIECKYFKVTFYKKGTIHLVFNCPELIERFNIFAAQERNWLPPNYGKKHYNQMDEEEKEVIDSFQGEESYEKVLKRPDYYLAGIQSKIQLLGGN